MTVMETTLDRDALLVPDGTRLVHIGPPKTGTTALQGAFHAARAAAEAQGVHYAGRNRHSMSAVQAVLGRQSFYSTEGPPPIRHWRKLVDEIRAADAKRVVMSSEFFADANADGDPDRRRRPRREPGACRRDAAATRQDHPVGSGSSTSRATSRSRSTNGSTRCSTGPDEDLAVVLAPPPARPLVARWAEVVGRDE